MVETHYIDFYTCLGGLDHPYSVVQMDGIMHKWASPHFDDFEKNRAAT